MLEAISLLNRIAREVGIRERTKHRVNLWRIPKDWKNIQYYFGYTPWRTVGKDGKEGFFALKYRIYKNGKAKLVKAVRFAKRKKAKARSLKWYRDYYGVG